MRTLGKSTNVVNRRVSHLRLTSGRTRGWREIARRDCRGDHETLRNGHIDRSEGSFGRTRSRRWCVRSSGRRSRECEKGRESIIPAPASAPPLQMARKQTHAQIRHAIRASHPSSTKLSLRPVLQSRSEYHSAPVFSALLSRHSHVGCWSCEDPCTYTGDTTRARTNAH
jgi:hypothetical protein